MERYTAFTNFGKKRRFFRLAPAQLQITGRRIGSLGQQNEVSRDIQEAIRLNASDIRVNQQQVNGLAGATGDRVGINRPDLQYTLPNGMRVNIEYDTPTYGRGIPHANRILANDPNGIVILKIIP
jgi:hypothetical protein